MKIRAMLAAVAMLAWASPALPATTSSPAPPTQCVSNIQAGGTVNGLTSATLPCALTTNLLLMTNGVGANTGAVTYQPIGLPAQAVVHADGSALVAGDTGAIGTVLLLSATGTKWLLLTPQAGNPVGGSWITNLPLIGSAAGGIAQGTKSGNSTLFAVVDATPVTGNCAVFDSAGGLNNVACSPSGSGTVGAGLKGQPTYYLANGTSVVGIAPACQFADAIGFNGNGSAVNDSVYATWATGVATTGGCLQFGSGTYVFTGTAQTIINLAAGVSVSIFGVGSNNTILKFTNVSIVQGIVFTFVNPIRSSFHLRDMTILTTALNSGVGFGASNVSGIEDNYAPTSDIENVNFKGQDLDTNPGTSNECWATAIQLFAVSYVYMYNVNTFGSWGAPGSAGCGTGLLVEGDATHAIYATNINIVNSSFNLHTNGWLLESYWQGVSCSLCNWNGEEGTTCVDIPSSQAGVLVLLNVNNSQLNCNGPQILVGTITFNVMVNNNVISPFGNNSVGVDGAMYQSTIGGNQINNTGGATGTVGIAVTSGSTAGMITGNTFTGLALAIDYSSGASNWNNQSNTYNSVGTPVVNNCGASCKSGGGSP